MTSSMIRFSSASVLFLMITIAASAAAEKESSKSAPAALEVAKAVDAGILAELTKAAVPVADLCSDADFLRRASLDLTGQLPKPQEVIAFCEDQSADKRTKLIDRLIDSPEFGNTWARYWRDVIYSRATDQRSRINQREFETWMAEQWNQGTGWDATVTSLLTATGNVQEHPETALIFAQGGVAEEVAAESCRIFLGIQLQCANCHDHPSDIWKREQFHQLAAYFPRISVRRSNETEPKFEVVSVNNDRKPGEFMRENPEMFVTRLDRNGDHKLSKEELLAGPRNPGARKKAQMMDGPKEKDFKPNEKMIDRMFEFGDANKDGLLSPQEIKNMPAPNGPRRGSTEHHMVDLQHPNEQGRLIDPKFFVDGSALRHGETDEERRQAVARAYTAPSNPWFARAIVNRIWAEMLGEGFYAPVDDLGPNRNARYPEVLDLICQGFVANDHNPKWLVRTIANTSCYQRKIQPKSEAENTLPFASQTPVPLRSDVIFNSLLQVFGLKESELPGGRSPQMAETTGDMKEVKDKEEMKAAPDKPKPQRQLPRAMFDSVFGFDPSLPKDEITGTIPQSLLMMNSRRFRAGMAARPGTQLGKILQENKGNHEAIKSLFLLVLAREPVEKEYEYCLGYIADVKNRPEAFEDMMWCLLNSSEFISRR